MTHRSSRWVDTLAARLVPPACAEHVLGDLTECSSTPGQYLRQLLSVLPYLLWSQVRRRITIGGLVFGFIFSGLLLIACQRVPKEPFLESPANWLRLLAVLVVWMATSTLSAVYGPADRPTVSSYRLLLLSVVVTAATSVALDVPALRVVLALVFVIGSSLLLTMPWLTSRTPPPLSMQTLDAHARLFQKTIWWRNARESLGAAAVLYFNISDLFQIDHPVAWAGHVLLVAGMLFIVGYLHTRAASRPVPAHLDAESLRRFHRDALAHQRNILRAVPIWYLLPFVPGMFVIAASKWSTTGPSVLLVVPIVAGIFWLVWRLNVWAAVFLDKQLAEVDALRVNA